MTFEKRGEVALQWHRTVRTLFRSLHQSQRGGRGPERGEPGAESGEPGAVRGEPGAERGELGPEPGEPEADREASPGTPGAAAPSPCCDKAPRRMMLPSFSIISPSPNRASLDAVGDTGRTTRTSQTSGSVESGEATHTIAFSSK